ncbi:leucine-rich repeat domain-containing protein [Brachyspira sp. SAP_772]|uniref:leucine-rich repeat domain-containing protein n=1 Tax=Brachyspira sp. SAP_772 TaxID=2608385 RepID=UPI0012F4E2A4|nr:leucine-rich repeat domain-containing protein [Brachyspira sp. SAP_772]
MYKRIVLIMLCFLVAMSCSSPSSPNNQGNIGNSGDSGQTGGNSGNSGGSGNIGDAGGIPWTEIAPPLPILDDEAKTYGIDISQDDNLIKQEIKSKLQAYYNDKKLYKVIFTGTPKAEYAQRNSLTKLVIEVTKDLPIGYNKNIEIDISNIYFNERKIKSKMFQGYTSSGEYTITFKFPENIIRVIEGNAFSLFSKFLKEITIPDSVIGIDAAAFQTDYKLEKVTFGANSKLEYIGDLAFTYSALKEITIPASVKSIGSRAFGSSSSLTTVIYLGTSPNDISHSGNIFDDTVTTLIVPNAPETSEEELKSKWQNFLGCNFTTIKKQIN